MERFDVLLEARPFCVFEDRAMKDLEESGLNIADMRGSGIEKPDFIEAIKNSDAIICGNDLAIDDNLLDMTPKLKIIAKMGAGLDAIDIEAATRREIIICNTPGANRDAVADHTFALLLSVARKIIYCDQSLREKRWEHTKIMGVEIWQKTLGLIGLGAIGQSVALRAKGFRMKLAAYDPFWPEEFAREHEIKKIDTIEKLLKTSDIISIHSPLTPENKGIINKKAFAMMKSSAFLINAARGGIVNEDDLYVALRDKVIAGAGIDVFEKEPPSSSPLLDLQNVVLTPHTAAFTHEAMNNMSMGVAEQVIGYFNGKKPEYIVNPQVYKKENIS